MSKDLSTELREVIMSSTWNQGKEFNVIIKDDHILVCLAGKPRYTLEELIAQCELPAEGGAEA